MLLAVLAGSVKSIRFLTPNEPDLLLPGEADLIPPVPRTPDGSMPYGKVELKSGARYTGFIANHDEGPSLVNREIVLSSPITIRNRGTFTVLDRWASVVLPGSEVSMVSITNHNDNPAALVEHLAAEHERSKWDNAANRRRPLWARRGIGI
jgi:hypothetical protein